MYFDIIYYLHLDWIALFIRDTNKCNFDIYKYNRISLLRVLASLTQSSGCSMQKMTVPLHGMH